MICGFERSVIFHIRLHADVIQIRRHELLHKILLNLLSIKAEIVIVGNEACIDVTKTKTLSEVRHSFGKLFLDKTPDPDAMMSKLMVMLPNELHLD